MCSEIAITIETRSTTIKNCTQIVENVYIGDKNSINDDVFDLIVNSTKYVDYPEYLEKNKRITLFTKKYNNKYFDPL